jgi:flagellin-like protein
MNKKGISPLIASVLLIAFVMAIASIFATFATNVVDQPRQETVERSQQLTQCSNAIVDVEAGNRTFVELQQSAGDNPAGNMSVVFQYNGSAPVKVYDQIETKRGITRTFVPSSEDPGSDASLRQVSVSIVSGEDEDACTTGPQREVEFPIDQQ